MKKYILTILTMTIVLLMISSATAVPNTKSKNPSENPNNFKQLITIEQKLEDLNIFDITPNGIIDWLIELIKNIIQFIQRLINLVKDLIEIIDLIEKLIEAIQTLIGHIQILIERILDLLPSQEEMIT